MTLTALRFIKVLFLQLLDKNGTYTLPYPHELSIHIEMEIEVSVALISDRFLGEVLMLRFAAVVLAFLGLISCFRPPEMIGIDYSVEDNRTEQRIDLAFKNGFTFCIRLSRSMWPTEEGLLDSEPGRVYLLIEGEKYFLQRMNLDDCAGTCPGRIVQPGAIVTGFLLYSDFGLPEYLFDKKKELVFNPVGYQCR